MWFGFVIGCVLGMFAGVFIMCLMQVARDPMDGEGGL